MIMVCRRWRIFNYYYNTNITCMVLLNTKYEYNPSIPFPLFPFSFLHPIALLR